MQLIDWSNLLIFGNFTPLFFSIIATVYIMNVGGVLKGLFSGILVNLMIIAVTYFINSYWGYQLDLLSLVVLEIFLAVTWVLSLSKT
jgi:hypothetical protein